MSASPPIIYTWTDEAPALATHAFLPVIHAYAALAGVPIETRDISLAGRMLAAFADMLPTEQRGRDDLAELGRMVETPEANNIKLPNVSASVQRLKGCIAELRGRGYALPDYPDEPIAAAAGPTRTGATCMTLHLKRPPAICFEHSDWFRPLFSELDRRGVPYDRIHAERHHLIRPRHARSTASCSTG